MTKSLSKDNGLSGVDEDSLFERALTKYVNEPIVSYIPRSIKPNTISILNHLCVWSTLGLAFLSISLDETKEEYIAAKMNIGRDLSTARSNALICRLTMTVLIFASMVMDCLDGMHARATGQSSRLGEVMDHALDAANIPLLSACTVVNFSSDIYTRAITMVAGGLVFNSQLVVYRHRGKMVKPPANGPESQMLLVVAQIIVAFVFWSWGRFHPYVDYFIFGVSILANVIQFRNAWYFWTFLDQNSVWDHCRFAVTTTSFAILFMTGYMSDIMFEVVSVLIAFRLSGAYVLFTVTNKHIARDNAEAKRAKMSLQSSFTSLYSGFDIPCLLFIVVCGIVQYVVSDESIIADRFRHPGYIRTMAPTEVVLMVMFAIAINCINVMDLKKCLSHLVPKAVLNAPMYRLFV